MFHRVAFKWLSITVIVLVGFLVVLLFLGYLLKENEIKTTKLKVQLEQEAYQRREKSRKATSISFSQASTAEKSQLKIIANNRDCQSNKQCFVVFTHSQIIGCIVAVNIKGTAILLKVASENESKSSAGGSCQKEYQNAHNISAQCKDNLCAL